MVFKMALVGECYGEEEALYKRPFIGTAGEQFNTLLADAGIRREECFITNVFNLRPPGKNIESLCGPPRDPGVIPGRPSLTRGLYLRKEYEGELTRLTKELEDYRPNIIVALGNTASWALLDTGAISKIRGTCTYSKTPPGVKLLPTHHPADLRAQPKLRHVTVLDLLKAKREAEFPELRRPVREIWMDPSLSDMETFFEAYCLPTKQIAYDVETANGQITCIGFSPSINRAIVISFLDYRFPGGHYWPTVEAEVAAWEWVRRTLNLPGVAYITQNGLYDVQYLWKAHGISCRIDEDTMLLHHALQPESKKSLGFLGSVYTNEIAWKPQRPRGKHSEKPEDSE